MSSHMATRDTGSCLQKPSNILPPATLPSEELNPSPQQEHRGSSQPAPALTHMCRALFSFPLIPVYKTRAAEILYHEEEWLSHSQCAGEAGLAGSSGQGKQSQESSSCASRMVLCPGKCLTQLEVAAGITQPGHGPCAQSCPPCRWLPGQAGVFTHKEHPLFAGHQALTAKFPSPPNQQQHSVL